MTGASDAPLALSEIGVSNPDSTFGRQRPGHGQPFIFLLRDLLQDQSTLAGVQQALQAANRTIDLILGFGAPNRNSTSLEGDDGAGDSGESGAAGEAGAGIISGPFVGVQYAADEVRFYNDENMLPVNNSWHPRVKDTVYHGMDWDCPGWTGPLGEALAKCVVAGLPNPLFGLSGLLSFMSLFPSLSLRLYLSLCLTTD